MNKENDESSESTVIVIESLCQWFMHSCNACPVFLMGCIQDALVSAFSSTKITDRRPLLVYIHHDHSMSIDRFCSNLFCNEIIMDYLLENYIIWPWNITDELNRNILIKIWEENFPSESSINFSMEQCPMLIGIIRRFPRENDPFASLPYEFKELVAGDNLMRTSQPLNLHTLLDQLIIFKEEFDENEQYLSFNFVKNTGLCWDMVLNIAEYLPLNDVVTTFSFDILPLLGIRLPIVKPSDEFMKTMIQKINPERIVSFHVEANDLKTIMKYPSAIILNNIILLMLDNLQHVNQINEFKTYFSNLNCLSLHYNNEVNFHTLSKIINQLQIPIKQFEIHCISISCSHRCIQLLYTNKSNYIIESFILNIADISLSLNNNNCIQRHVKCLLRTITDFIKIMSNIRHVRMIINRGNIDTLLDKDEWITVVKACRQLKKITIKIMRNMSQDQQLLQKVQNIQNGLHDVLPSIEFDVKVK